MLAGCGRVYTSDLNFSNYVSLIQNWGLVYGDSAVTYYYSNDSSLQSNYESVNKLDFIVKITTCKAYQF